MLLNCNSTSLFKQLINIARFIEMWMIVRVCVSAHVRVSFNQVQAALHIYFHLLFPTQFNNSHFIHNCLLCKNPGNEFPLVTKNESLIYEAVNIFIFMHTVYKMYTCVFSY